ncbi:MAG: hypothetical protein QOJ09_1411 [Actinomycetota bacterium]|jgi:peptidoglycan/LPS O-acetylase OafA/YrhL|nr:hypothetical protein [Actinomycetota bacterium]
MAMTGPTFAEGTRQERETTVSQAGEPRSAHLEALRAVAALGVLVGHVFGTAHNFNGSVYRTYGARLLLGGGLGVFLFFALTGYLLYLPFARRDFGAGGAVDLKRYATNRAVRVLPLYYVVLVVLFALQEHVIEPRRWVQFGLMLQSFSHAALNSPLDGPMWSLIVEVHYYLLLPLLAFVIAKLAQRSPWRAIAVLAVLGIVSLALRTVTVTLDHHDHRMWEFSLPTTFFFFVPGSILALLRVGWEGSRPRWAETFAAHGDLWLGAAVALWLTVVWDYRLTSLAAAASFFTLAPFVLPCRDGLGARLLALRPLALLGVASYSLYLWHYPIVLALGRRNWVPDGFAPLLLIAVPASLVVAFVSYRVVEAPFLTLRRRWAASSPAPRQ